MTHPSLTAGRYDEPSGTGMGSELPATSPTMVTEKSWHRAAWTENLELNLNSFSKVLL